MAAHQHSFNSTRGSLPSPSLVEKLLRSSQLRFGFIIYSDNPLRKKPNSRASVSVIASLSPPVEMKRFS
ncbi:hypothetical protein E2C01_067122 [Portunus trituberculatus]|uniref:Uncharacterized protein n=1 Tax=Portunus trituberculatus TaxID=210409 RepID=A0A5B7HVQ6_PORTR|nr:hypothetical protein [Portunus trituberculatus]